MAFDKITNISAITGLESPMIYGKPFDGSGLFATEEDQSAKPQWKEFQKLMQFVGQWEEDYLDPWIRKKLPTEAFATGSSPLWMGIKGITPLDSIGATLYATNACGLKYGLGFTDEQLHAEIMQLDFEGLGSHVQFDANGDRLATVRILNVRYLWACEPSDRPLAVLACESSVRPLLLLRVDWCGATIAFPDRCKTS